MLTKREIKRQAMTTNSELNGEERWEQFYRRMVNLANEGWELFQTMDPDALEKFQTKIIFMAKEEYSAILAMTDAVFQRCIEIWYWACQEDRWPYVASGGAGLVAGGAIASKCAVAATVGVTAVVGTVAVTGAYNAGKRFQDQGIAGKCCIAATTTGVGAALGGIAAAKSAAYLGVAVTNPVIAVGAVAGAAVMGGAAVRGHLAERERECATLRRENAALRRTIANMQ